MADYCTVSAVKSALDMTSATHDNQLSRIITSASRWIDEVCECGENGFAIGADATRYFERDAVEGKVLWLDKPLLTVTTLTRGDATVLGPSTYRLWPLNETIKRLITLRADYSWAWTDSDSLITVVGKWGYSTSVPQPVSEAAIIMSAWMQQRYMAGLADASASFELGQLTYSKPIPEQAKALLSPWIERRMLV